MDRIKTENKPRNPFPRRVVGESAGRRFGREQAVDIRKLYTARIWL